MRKKEIMWPIIFVLGNLPDEHVERNTVESWKMKKRKIKCRTTYKNFQTRIVHVIRY